MRIGLITGEYPPMQGGVGAYSQILAHRLHDLGHEVYVFTSALNAIDRPEIHITPWDGRWNWQAWRAIGQWAQEHYLRVVNLQFQTAAYGMSPWVHFLQNQLSVPLVTTFHDLRHPYLFPKAGALRDWIVMYLARSSAGVIVTNHEDYERIKTTTQAMMIPIGSNILPDTPEGYTQESWRVRVGIEDGEFVLAHFGFMNHSKGIETLLDALALLRGRGLPVKLLMIGGRTGSSDVSNIDYANQIDAKIALMGLHKVVHWTGYVDEEEVSAYLWASDVVTLPYRDGASFRRGSLMAAIQHNCAIISTEPLISIPEFKHGHNLVFVERDNAEALAGAIERLYEHRDELERLQFGAAELKHSFNWTMITRKTLRLFERVCDV